MSAKFKRGYYHAHCEPSMAYRLGRVTSYITLPMRWVRAKLTPQWWYVASYHFYMREAQSMEQRIAKLTEEITVLEKQASQRREQSPPESTLEERKTCELRK